MMSGNLLQTFLFSIVLWHLCAANNDDAFDLKPNQKKIVFASENFPNPAPAVNFKNFMIYGSPFSKIELECSTKFQGQPQCLHILELSTRTHHMMCNLEVKKRFSFNTSSVAVTFSSRNMAGGIFLCQAWVEILPDKQLPFYLNDLYLDPDSTEIKDQNPNPKPTSCKCGWTNSAGWIWSRVVNGIISTPRKYPWMVSLQEINKNGGLTHFCGGSIITPRHILTAGHCVSMYTDPKNVTARIAAHNLTAPVGSDGSQEIVVSKIIIHERYDGTRPGATKPLTKQYDIAILVLEKEIIFTNTIGPVCLPNAKTNFERKYMKAMGWGQYIDINVGPKSDVLREVYLKGISLNECNSINSLVNLKEPHQICLFNTDQKNVCAGDSGGPLLWLDPSTNGYTLAGIASYVSVHCGSNFPTVYTDVSAFLPWIQQKIDEFPNMKTCSALN